MAVESLIVIITAKMAARTPYKNPFCESCKEWFGAPKTVVIPLTGAEALVNALSSGSALPLQGISINATSAEQIQVDLACCDCHASGYVLTATLRWAEERKGEIKSKTQPWFSTIVPSALGAEIERWTAAATQPPPAQAQVQTSAPQHTQEAMPHSPAAPAPATASVIPVAVEPSPPATQPDKQTSSTEICKRCGRSMNTASCTCPHCGHTQWGMVIGTTLFSLVCLGVTVLGGSRISAAFWRSIVMWGGGVIGGLVLLVAVVWIGKGLLTHQKPLSEISSAVSVTLEPTPTAEVVTPPTVVAALVPDPIQATPVVKPPEIDWLSISRLCQEGDFEAVTRLLVTLDKRSDLEYTTDKDAYDKTCRLIKEVGTQLDRKGGEDLMRQVLTRAGALGCNTRFVEREWNGIGSWWG